MIGIFQILPLIFMILIAFTNYDLQHMPPGTLFHWVGFQNFASVFDVANSATRATTFVELAKWTLVWAVCATFTNYILGMIIALMINKKGIKFKALWRTLFVIAIAVPQFVSLLLMNRCSALTVHLMYYLQILADGLIPMPRWWKFSGLTLTLTSLR